MLANSVDGVSDHGELTGLTDDDHAQYALLAGRSGGQIWNLGLDSGDSGEIHSTAHGTKGTLNLCDFAYLDEVNGRLGIGIDTPTEALDVDGGNIVTTGKLAVGTAVRSTEHFTVQTPKLDLVSTGAQLGGLIRARAQASANNSIPLSGCSGEVQIFGSYDYTGSLTGITGGASHVGTGTINVARGVHAKVAVSNGIAGTIANARSLSTSIDAEDGTITSAQGLYIDNFLVDTGSIGTAYGIYLQEQTNASTNWSLYIKGGDSFMGGTLSIDQPSIAAAVPVLTLDQADVSEEFIKFIGGTIHTGKSGADEYLHVETDSGVRYIKLYT